MTIIDFMVGTGELAAYNYVEVADTPETVSDLKSMGCTDAEIVRARDEGDPGCLEVYDALRRKGYAFEAGTGSILYNG